MGDDDASFSGLVGPSSDAQQGVDALRSEMASLQAQLKVALSSLASLKSDVDGMHITGDGFNGSGPNGISYTAPKPATSTVVYQPYSLELCDGTTLDVAATNVVGP